MTPDPQTVYYLAGPMSGIPEYNFPAFTSAASRLRAHGYQVLSAHEIKHDEEKTGQLPWTTYLRDDLIQLVRYAHAIVLLPGWTASRGARLELTVALALEMPVYFYTPGGLVAMSDRSREPKTVTG